jgi:myo-inositol-1(or 4)-monophosphatase
VQGILEYAKDLAVLAGRKLLDHWSGNFPLRQEVRFLNEGEYSSPFDSFIEEFLVTNIHTEYPNHNILTEERGFIEGDSEYTWILDPIDGTNQFVRHLPNFATSIAIKKEQNLHFAVVFAPVLDQLFWGSYGDGSFYLRSGRSSINYCSDVKAKDDSMISISTYGSFRRQHREDLFAFLNINLPRIRIFGSPSIDLCYVAQGSLDARIIASGEYWDYAAGILIVEEAGGKVTDWQGNPIKENCSQLVATNGLIHDEILDLLNAV